MGKPEWGEPEWGKTDRKPLWLVFGLLLALTPLLWWASAGRPGDTSGITGVPGPERYRGPGGYTNYNKDMQELQRGNMRRMADAAAAKGPSGP